MRRTLIIAGVALVVIGVASYLAWALSRPSPAPSSTGAPTNLFARLFPFGTGNVNPTQSPTVDSGQSTDAPQAAPQLRKISDKPVAGGAAFVTISTTSPQAAAIIIRFIERETGHVYETPADALTVTRISNTTVPRIEKVLWIDAHHFIARYLGDSGAPQNFYATLAPGKTEQSLQGTFITAFHRAALDPKGTALLSVTEGEGGARVSLSKPDGTNARTVFTSPLRSWIPLQSTKNIYTATAPSANVPGYLYQIVNGALQKVTGGIPGMTASISPSGRYVAVSSGRTSGAIALAIYDTTSGTFYDVPLATISEKCAWVSESPVVALICGVPTSIPSGAYPNDWLLGNVSFSDQIWGIEPISGATTLLVSPTEQVDADIDVWQPRVTGAYLTFINKRDLSFWSFRFLEVATGTPAR